MNARNSFSLPSAHCAALALLLVAVWSVDAAAQASPSPYTYATRYDLMGRVTGTIAPDPDGAGLLKHLAVRNTYDAAGRLIKVESGQLASWSPEGTEPKNWSGFDIKKIVETTYNAQNQKTLEIVKGENGVATAATQYSYDNFGRSLCSTVRMNPAVYGSLPDACTLWTEGSFGPDRITKNHYNARGDLIRVQKAVGIPGLVEDYAIYTYSPNGNRDSITDARGYKATMTFDGFDRQNRWNLPKPDEVGVPSATDFEEYGYDQNSNRTSLVKRDGSTLTYEFDALNRMTRKLVPERQDLDPSHTRDVYYVYDSFSRMRKALFDSFTSNQGITTDYNGFSEVTLTSVQLAGFAASLTFQFDANGNRERVNYSDGNYVEYGYDGLDRSKSIVRSGSGNSTLVNYTYNSRGARATMGGSYVTSYGYHPDGRLSSLTNSPMHPNYSAQYTFGYNPASQIVQQSRNNDAFAWTGAVNLNQSYSANGLNQYTAVGGVAHSHDANGNLTVDGSTTYLYDVENRLVSASGAKNATLRYDPMGRLYETTGGTAGLTRLAYDGDALVQEFNSSGTLLRRYVHGADAGDDPLVWFEGAGFTDTQQRLLRTDHQGSIVAVADATSAGFHAINSYDEYGNQSAANQGRFQYTGQTWMPELGLYYYKARMYSPTLGRFMQTDPIGYEDDINLYAYVGNDPMNGIDPTGMCSMSVTPIICRSGGGSHGDMRGQSTSQMLTNSPVGEMWRQGEKAVGDAVKPVADHLARQGDIEVTAGAHAMGGIEGGITVDQQTFQDKTVEGTFKADMTGTFGLDIESTVNYTFGDKDIGKVRGSISFRPGLIGGELNFGEGGVNFKLSLGPQCCAKFQLPIFGTLPSVGTSVTTRLPLPGAQ